MITIFFGSISDSKLIKPAIEYLKEMEVPFDAFVCSAHRTPEQLINYIHRNPKCKVYIAAAGKAAHLAGCVAAHTTKPVIGLPLSGGLYGFDSLLSTVQMPSGVPVACVGVDAARNAAQLAVQILALSDDRLAKLLKKKKDDMVEEIRKQNEEFYAMIH